MEFEEWAANVRSRRAVMAAIAGTSAGCIAGEFPSGGGTTSGGGTSSSPGGGGGSAGCAPSAYGPDGGRRAPVQACPMEEHPRHEGPVWAMAWSSPEQKATSKFDKVDDMKLYPEHKPYKDGPEGDLIYDFNGIREELDYISFASKGGTRAWGYGGGGGGGMLNLAETTSLDNPVYKKTNGSRNWDRLLDEDEEILRNAEPGRRGFTTFSWFTHFRGQPLQRPEADPRDGLIITTLAEDLNGEKTSQIEVEPCNFGIPNNTPFNRDNNNYGYLATPKNHNPLVKKPGGAWDIPFEESNVSFATMNTAIEEGVTTIDVGQVGGENDAEPPVRLWGEKGDPVYYGNKGSAWKYHGVQMASWVVDKHLGALKERIGEDALDYLFFDWEFGLQAPFGLVKQDPRYTDPKHGFNGKSMQELEDEKGAGFVKSAAQDWILHAAYFKPAKKHFPDLEGSNYNSVGVAEDNPLGVVHPTVFGTHGSQPRYPRASPPYKTLWRLQQNVRYRWAATNGRWMPWIAWKSWTGDSAFPYPVGNNFYWDETVRHEALHEPDPILYWWQPGEGSGTGPEDDKILDSVLGEVNEQLGGGYSLMTYPEQEDGEWNEDRFPEVKAEGLEDSRYDVVTGVKREDGTALWRISCRRFGFTDNKTPMPDDSPPIEVTIAEEGGSEIDTVTIEGGTPGTWWSHDEATTDLTFTLDYPADKVKK